MWTARDWGQRKGSKPSQTIPRPTGETDRLTALVNSSSFVLTDEPTGAVKQERGGRGTGSYDWTGLFDGQVYLLEFGVDYYCQDQTFRNKARKEADKRGLKVKIAKVNEGLVVQAIREGEGV